MLNSENTTVPSTSRPPPRISSGASSPAPPNTGTRSPAARAARRICGLSGKEPIRKIASSFRKLAQSLSTAP